MYLARKDPAPWTRLGNQTNISYEEEDSMKKIIAGKLYDTSTAEEIGSRSYGKATDLNRLTETLYRKEDGELFLYGKSGPKGKYSRRLSPDSWASGEAIFCEPDFDPKKWVEEHLDVDTYVLLFGLDGR